MKFFVLMRIKLKNRIVKNMLFAFLFSASGMAYGQLSVSTGMTASQLVQNVLVGSGVTVSNVTYNGAAGTIGYFTTGGTPTNLGMSSGIIMATGYVDGSNLEYPIGSPSSNFNSGTTGTGSDPQLASLVSSTINDAAALEFDFTPLSDTIKFKYVFASEEYPEWVGSSFNDVFGFFVNGPDPSGGNYTNKNIALIPNTTTPVAINNVNSGSYSQYYVDNTYGIAIVYDGFTTVLTAWCKVIPCLTYHLKLAIGDAGDAAYDSAVFLEENSFSTNALSVATSFTTNLDTMAIEGCSDAIVSFTLQNPATTPYVINYTIGGTATNGTDYTTIPTSVTIPTGQDSVSVTIDPLLDGITEGNEYVTLTVQTSVCGNVQVYTIWIKDNTQLIASAAGDTTICGGQATITSAGSGGIPPYTFQWDNGAGINSTSIVSPATTTNYVVTVTDGCVSTATANVLVTVASGVADAGPDVNICLGASTSLVASAGSGYQWSNGSTTQTNTVNPVVTTTYYLTITGTCSGFDSVTVYVNPLPVITVTASADSICPGANTTLSAGGASSYSWTSTPNDPSLSGQQNSANPIVSPLQTTIYNVTGTDANTCINTATITIIVNPLPVITALTSDDSICSGESVTLAAGGGISYTWSSTPTDPSLAGQETSVNPVVSPTQTTIYNLTGIGVNTCTNNASVSIRVLPLPVSSFTISPQAVCINEDATITFNGSASSSANYSWDFGGGSATGSGQGPYLVNWATVGNKTITLSINDHGCLSQVFSGTVTVNPVPTALFYATNTAGCAPLTVFFHDSSLNVTSSTVYEWDFGDQTISNLQNPAHTFVTPGTYGVTLTITNGNLCSSVYTIPNLIDAYSSPDAEFVTVPHVVSIFDPQVHFNDLSTGSPLPDSWEWNLGDGTTESGQIFSHTYADTGIYLVTLVVHDINGCSDSAYNYVYVNPDYTMFIPSAFTPNNNGNNDYFLAYGVNILAFNMKIFDRWGSMLFESADIRFGWDGKVNGTVASLGNYVYVIYYMDALHKEHTVYGNVMLLR